MTFRNAEAASIVGTGRRRAAICPKDAVHKGSDPMLGEIANCAERIARDLTHLEEASVVDVPFTRHLRRLRRSAVQHR